MQSRYSAWPAVIAADALALVLFLALGRPLVDRFRYQFAQTLEFTAAFNALLLVALFFLFLVGQWQLLKLPPAPDAGTRTAQREVRIGAVVLFVAVFGLILGDAAGFLASLQGVVNFGEMGNATYMLFSGGLFIFVPLIYLLLLLNPVAVAPGGAVGRRFMGTLLSNLFLLGIAAYMAGLAARTNNSGILWLLPLAAGALGLFGRLSDAERADEPALLLTYAVFLAGLTFLAAGMAPRL